MLKTAVLLNICAETGHFFSPGWIENSKEQHLFEILSDFTVTFDQFNAFLINKSINFFKNNLINPKLLNGTVFNFYNIVYILVVIFVVIHQPY